MPLETAEMMPHVTASSVAASSSPRYVPVPRDPRVSQGEPLSR